jgi:hypothetical protein
MAGVARRGNGATLARRQQRNFYLASGGIMTAVPVSTLGTFSSGTPVPLFQFHGRAAISSTDAFSYDVSKDGKRFLVNRYVKPERITPLTIVLHAGAEK